MQTLKKLKRLFPIKTKSHQTDSLTLDKIKNYTVLRKKNQQTNNARTSNSIINNSWSDEAAVYAKPPVKPISRLIEVQLWCSFGFAQPSVDPHRTWRRTVYLHNIYILQEMLHTRGNDINEWVYFIFSKF